MGIGVIMRASIKKILLLSICSSLFAVFGVSNASGQIVNEIVSRMDRHNQSLTSLRANITMVKVNEQLGGVTDTQEGTVIYEPQRRGNPRVRIDWRSPNESFALVGNEYTIYRPNLKQAITGNVNQARNNSQNLGSALAFMNMSREELRSNFNVALVNENASLRGGVRTWHLRMTPKSRTSYRHAEVWVDANGMPVQTRIVEHNNDSTTILLSAIQKNIRINRTNFEIRVPRGTNIVKG
jgi:outer membrane lipoprotein-sorting protein